MDCSRPKTHDLDTWLDLAPEASRAMAEQVRNWIQRWEPDLTESIKWNMLCFSGRKLVCGLSACKKHLGITFFRGTELRDITKLFNRGEGNTSILSFQVRSLKEFDAKAFQRLLHAAVALDADGTAKPPPPKQRKQWPMPETLAKALKKNKAAAAGFAAFKPTYQRDTSCGSAQRNNRRRLRSDWKKRCVLWRRARSGRSERTLNRPAPAA